MRHLSFSQAEGAINIDVMLRLVDVLVPSRLAHRRSHIEFAAGDCCEACRALNWDPLPLLALVRTGALAAEPATAIVPALPASTLRLAGVGPSGFAWAFRSGIRGFPFWGGSHIAIGFRETVVVNVETRRGMAVAARRVAENYPQERNFQAMLDCLTRAAEEGCT